jgi:modulator of FtsH protease HflK
MVQMRRVPPDMDKIKQFFRAIRIPLILVVLVALVSSFWFTVDAGEQAVITRFGAFERIAPPGLHFKFPFGVEQATKIRVDLVRKQEFGFRSQTDDGSVFDDTQNFATTKRATRYSPNDYTRESLMLTGDLNQADVEFSVQYRVSSAKDYLFSVRDPERTLRALAESAMRGVVGDSGIDEVLGKNRMEIQAEALKHLQAAMDLYQCGIKVERVVLQSALPPGPVAAAFTAVNNAEQEKNTMINEALKAFNQVIPEARGQAEQTVSNAEGYRLERVNRALGEASRFEQILTEYTKAKPITRKRIYFETLAEVLPRMNKTVIIDADVKSILQHLDLAAGLSAGGGK